MPGPPADLTWTPATTGHLAAHKISVDDALAVFANDPVFFEQAPAPEFTSAGFFRIRPRRLQMIGHDDQGRLLLFILELPDEEGESLIVSGWEADGDEHAVYEYGS